MIWTDALCSSPYYIAGIYLLGSGRTVRPGSDDVRVDSACKFLGSKSIHPFAFRTHAHSLGKDVRMGFKQSSV